MSYEKFDRICVLCKSQQFKKRGKAFFRVWGNGVLQVLKYSYRTRPFRQEEVSIGLFSMYSELLPQWFTSWGCIPRYDARHLKKPRCEYTKETFSVTGNVLQDLSYVIYELEESLLEEYVFPFLNNTSDQASLITATRYQDWRNLGYECDQPDLFWNDLLKFAPYLYMKDWDSASRVISSILAQHQSADKSNKQRMTQDEYEKYRNRDLSEEKDLEDKLLMAQERDLEKISAYLNSNYRTNCMLAKFCM